MRPCLFPGCTELVERSYCAAHGRPSAAKRGYDRRWQAYRRQWLKQHPLCGDRLNGANAEHSVCAQQRRAVVGSHVDHIVPIKGPDDPLFYDPANHQTLCPDCHARKTAIENQTSAGDGRITIVCGEPGAGKTMFVARTRKRGDLVWDFDAIADVIAQCPTYPRPAHVATVLAAMRDTFVKLAVRVPARVFIIVGDEFAAARVHATIPSARLVRLTRAGRTHDQAASESSAASDAAIARARKSASSAIA
jgi:5-methylcytosine-specific restriction protein A